MIDLQAVEVREKLTPGTWFLRDNRDIVHKAKRYKEHPFDLCRVRDRAGDFVIYERLSSKWRDGAFVFDEISKITLKNVRSSRFRIVDPPRGISYVAAMLKTACRAAWENAPCGISGVDSLYWDAVVNWDCDEYNKSLNEAPPGWRKKA